MSDIAELESQIADSIVEGRLPCPRAFSVARKLNIAPGAVGEKADAMGMRVSDCQLGCFGAKKATPEELAGKPVDENVANAIRASLKEGRLPCADAYEIARKLKVSRQRVGDTANQLKIKIADCQLGCF